jgi:hypothetical protein
MFCTVGNCHGGVASEQPEPNMPGGLLEGSIILWDLQILGKWMLLAWPQPPLYTSQQHSNNTKGALFSRILKVCEYLKKTNHTLMGFEQIISPALTN